MQESPARDVNVRGTEPLISPVELVKQLPLTPTVEATVLEGREQIQSVLRGEILISTWLKKLKMVL